MDKTTIALDQKTFLSGPAGTGKTTLAVGHLRSLLAAGVPGDSILVLAPQRSLLQPYADELRRADLPAGSLVELVTLGGLARRMVDLFWPAVAGAAGFAHPQAPPIFLTLETAQYYMQQVVSPLMAEAGYFEGVHLTPNRLYSQLLDNLNKAAVVGFSHLEIGERLKAAWSGSPAQVRVFSQVQDCVARFRQLCRADNLLDFSLQVEVFVHHVWPASWFQPWWFSRHRHLIVDNVEEDTPVTHDLLSAWLAALDSALIVCDDEAGYRSLLGADPQSGQALSKLCQAHVALDESHVTSPDLKALAGEMARALGRHTGQPLAPPSRQAGDLRQALSYGGGRFHPTMLDWVTGEIVRLLDAGTAPEQIVVLAPYLGDALRFALQERLERSQVPAHALRPSRALNEELATGGLLTLAALAHPDWGIHPLAADVAYALTMAIDELDPVRAHLLAQRAYRPHPAPRLGAFEALTDELRDRIGYDVGQRYETLRDWLSEAANEPQVPLDHFLGRLFDQVLALPGFGFHRDLDGGRSAARLIASARKFRQAVTPSQAIGRAYLDLVEGGVIAASQPRLDESEAAVLLAPAYTFLLRNRPVEVQFWINAGSSGWWARLPQPLTHPYVLTRQWPAGQSWTDEHEQAARRSMLHRLIQGLIRRCRRKVYLAFSTLNEQGLEERGPLLVVTQQVLRHLPLSSQIGEGRV